MLLLPQTRWQTAATNALLPLFDKMHLKGRGKEEFQLLQKRVQIYITRTESFKKFSWQYSWGPKLKTLVRAESRNWSYTLKTLDKSQIISNKSTHFEFYKPVLEELQALLTAVAQASQNSGSLCIGHLSLTALSQNRQMNWTNALVSASFHSRFPDDLFDSFPSWNKLFLEVPSVDERLFSGLPGVLPQTTIGLLAAIIA